MDAAVDDCEFQTPYRCPVCGASFLYDPVLLPADEPCDECGAGLWCWRHEHDGVVILEPIPGRTPATEDVKLLVQSLRESGKVARVGVDLSGWDAVSSSFVAELVMLHRRIQEAGGRLFLFALNPIVLASLHRFRLDQVFEIVEHEGNAKCTAFTAMMVAH